MRNLLRRLGRHLGKASKSILEFLEKHGFFDHVVENLVKFIFLIIVFYIFKVFVW